MDMIRKVQELNKLELEQNLTDTASWHDQYKDSAYIYVGGLPFELTEGSFLKKSFITLGDLICIFSQYGEIIDCNLMRDKQTGKSKGFAFLAYEDQRSTVLAVDNLTGITILNRMIRVDHVAKYKIPKLKDADEEKEYIELKSQIIPKHLKSDYQESASEEDEDVDAQDPMKKYFDDKKKRKKDKKSKKSKRQKND